MTWGIIGLGWLGSALESELKIKGHEVWGTHRRDFDFRDGEFPAQPCEVLFLNTPPLIDLSPEAFVQKIPEAYPKIIFISSTSVYGEGSRKVTESSSTAPDTANGKWLVQVEKLLQAKFTQRVLVIRPGGLIGGDRHPVRYLSGRTQVPGGKDSINFIHRDDLVNIIMASAQEWPAPVINAVAPYHPAKSEYYNAWAEKLSLAPIQFEDNFSSNRQVDSEVLPSLYKNWICPRLDFI